MLTKFVLFSRVENVIPNLAPVLAALTASAVINLIAENHPNGVNLQSYVYAATFAVSVGYFLVNDTAAVGAVWQSFIALSSQSRFALVFFIISIAYFGAFIPSKPLEQEPSTTTPATTTTTTVSANDTPAASDACVTFDVPAELPIDDKVVFEEAFDRIVKEIIADLPSVYEMPSEAVQWVERMINYTVAGGKMNRGLALMSVQKEFAKAKGRELTNKVCDL